MDSCRINISAPNLMCICIDEADRNGARGRLYHKYSAEPLVFETISSLLREMDDIFDMIGYPERSTRRRTFRESKTAEKDRKEATQVTGAETLLKQSGELATFVVHVKFRQYSTWQGEIVWADKSKKSNFRSALEMLKLIDSALDEEAEARAPDEGAGELGFARE